MKKSGIKGIEDYLTTDKNFVKLFCVQLIFMYLHGISAAAGLILIAFSIIK